jgi:hypothetical protein
MLKFVKCIEEQKIRDRNSIPQPPKYWHAKIGITVSGRLSCRAMCMARGGGGGGKRCRGGGGELRWLPPTEKERKEAREKDNARRAEERNLGRAVS